MFNTCDTYDETYSKTLRKYVMANKFKKVSKMLKKNRHLLNVSLGKKKKQTGLHLAAKHGCCDTLRVYLFLGANACFRDTRKCFPLHYAAKYTLKNFSKSLSDELVSSLLTHSMDILDIPNKKGTTCRTMVTAVNKKLDLERKKISSNSLLRGAAAADSSTEDGGETSEEGYQWKERLEDEGQEDIAQFYGSASGSQLGSSSSGRYIQSFCNDDHTQETYDSWADIILKEYNKRRLASKKLLAPKSVPTCSSYEARATKKLPKLKLKQISDEEKYAHFCDLYLGEKSTLELTVEVFPFNTETESKEIVHLIIEKNTFHSKPVLSNDMKKRIRKELQLWHPDKFKQKFGTRFNREQQDEIERVINHVSQSLINYGKV